MKRKVVVPPPISVSIRQVGLSRAALIKLLTRVHEEFSERYDHFKEFREGDDDQLYWHPLVIIDGSLRHLFTFAIDDITSAGHLIIADVHHEVK